MSEEANSNPVDLGGDADLEFGVAAVNGKVIVRFNKLIQWFDMDPATTIAFAESLISKAQEAAMPKQNRAIRRATVADLRKLT